MKNRKLYLFLGISFISGLILGCVAGALGHLLLSNAEHFGIIKHHGRRGPGFFRKHAHERLCRELNMTEEQSQKAKPILDRLHEKMKNLHQQNRPVVKQYFEEMIQELSQHLTQEQIEQTREIKEKMSKRFGAPPPPPPPPPPREQGGACHEIRKQHEMNGKND